MTRSASTSSGDVLPLDPLGGDFEGIAVVRPTAPSGCATSIAPRSIISIQRGRAARALHSDGAQRRPASPSRRRVAGTVGTEALPAVLAQRRQNRGFEGIALSDGKIYAFVQSPVRNPATAANSALNARSNIRVVEFNPATTDHAAVHLRDGQPASSTGATDTRADKIGDAVATPERLPRRRARRRRAAGQRPR